jgi:hypothetical protein
MLSLEMKIEEVEKMVCRGVPGTIIERIFYEGKLKWQVGLGGFRDCLKTLGRGDTIEEAMNNAWDKIKNA